MTRPMRALAAASVAVVVVAYLSVLQFVVNVTGDPATLYALTGGSALAGAVLALVVRPRYALALAATILGGGAWLYLGSLPAGASVFDSLDPLVADSVSLLTGLSILRIINSEVWALSVAPAPTFLASYLTVRRRYVAGAAVAGATLTLLVLTGDAAPEVTLLGAVGVAGAMGFGDLARRGASVDRAETVAVVLAVLVVVPLAVSVVPQGSTDPFASVESGGESTVESSLVGDRSSIDIRGSISLSPKTRFRVESERVDYWRVGSFDRYTGSGWIRTGDTRPFDGSLSAPPGPSRQVGQQYTMLATMGSMPAAWKPTGVRDSPVDVNAVGESGLSPASPFEEGQSYRVVSRVPEAGPTALRRAGTDYPDRVRERYTQLPDSTPDRVAERTDRITANADNPYDTARVVEQWLENNRRYSLDVDRPDGDVADAFLFEMDRGYCTYFATTMVAMLRTQGVPARLVTGYTSGEQVGQNEWVARGLDSHAWVEVYFPEQGWIRFDPTPADPRETAEGNRIEQARENDEPGVDTNDTGRGGWTPTPEPTPTVDTPTPTESDGPTERNRTERTPDPNRFTDGGSNNTTTPAGGYGLDSTEEDDAWPEIPSREELALLAVVAFGAVAGVRRTGLDGRAYRAVWLRVHPRSDPVTDVRRAWDRLEYVLGRRERPRRSGETVRQYVAAVGDADARRLAHLYERAVYAGGVAEAEADQAIAIADSAVSSRSLLPWR